jgi:hypothetical protein
MCRAQVDHTVQAKVFNSQLQTTHSNHQLMRVQMGCLCVHERTRHYDP